jgi:hypothetical protein
MYINLYPTKQLQQTKRNFILLGAFLIAGGGYALVRDLVLSEQVRVGWAMASASVFMVGILLVAVGTDNIRLKDAYFSLNPERLSYRLSVLGREQLLYWKSISSLRITEQTVIIELQDTQCVVIRLGAIQDPEIAHHVAASLRLAALEKNVPVNGVQRQEPIVTKS